MRAPLRRGPRRFRRGPGRARALIASGDTPSALGVRRAARRDHRLLHQLGLVPGREHIRAGEHPQQPQGGPHHRQRQVQQPAAAAARAQDHADDLVVAELLGPGERGLGGPPLAVSARHHAVGHVLCPDRLVERPPGARDRHRGQPREALEQRQPWVAGRVDDRRAEDGRLHPRGGDRVLRERLRAEEARARVVASRPSRRRTGSASRPLARPRAPGAAWPSR